MSDTKTITQADRDRPYIEEAKAKIVARVFPRGTRATPDDRLAFVARPPMLADFAAGITEVHVSCSFTWDKPRAEQLADAWSGVAPVKLGGPAYGDPGGDFVPGLYLRPGYTITSRGCPSRCSECLAWRREGNKIRELPIHDGWNVLDNNLLACSEAHVRAVFAMLKRQKRRAEFTGGLEAARLRGWHVDLIADLKPGQVFFAYDRASAWEPLKAAANMIRHAWPAAISGHRLRCYVLIGFPGDTLVSALRRLKAVMSLGVMPMAMYWRGENTPPPDREWRQLRREYSNETILGSLMRETAVA